MSQDSEPGLSRRLGFFDATMLVMGGIIGSGIFVNPTVVARQVHTPFLVLGVWVFGGLVALAGAFVYAELAARRPYTGGQYAYLREAYDPSVAFVYGWSLLLVTQTGGMAAVAVIFADYVLVLTGLPVPNWVIAVGAIGVLTVINCFGVRTGSTAQNVLVVLKIGSIIILIAAGIFFVPAVAPPSVSSEPVGQGGSFGLLSAVGAAMIPVLFAYGGWQTANFIAGELRNPQWDLPRGLIAGVFGVVVLYLAVNYACVHTLGVDALAATDTPATEVMRIAFGNDGARFIAASVAVSALGFLSQGMLTAPRVYYAMAEDKLFFSRVGWLHPTTRVPVVAIAVQGVLAMVIAVSGRYDQILNYVVSVDFIGFGLTATCLFVFRRQDAARSEPYLGFSVPGHPWTTLFFVAASWLVVLNTIYTYPGNSAVGLIIVCTGVPVYLIWLRIRRAK